MHSDDEETWSLPPKGQGFLGAKPVRNPLHQDEGTRSPPTKRARQGTIGDEDQANIRKKDSDPQSTGKSSQAGFIRIRNDNLMLL